MLGHGIEGAEDFAVILQGLLGENLDPSARAEGAGRFVETDVTVAAEAEQLDVDAAGLDDAGFVGAALGVEIGRDAVRNMGAGDVDVDMPEKIFLHEKPVRLGVCRRQADVLVEVERRHFAEIQALIAMQSDQLLVKPERCATGG